MTNQNSRPPESMVRYRRLPAALILAAVVVAGAILVLGRAHAAQAGRNGGQAGWTVAQLELAIGAGGAGPQVWSLYGDRLMEQNRFGDAFAAYKRVLVLDPNSREAHIKCAVALTQAHANDDLYAFLKDLVLSDPKLAEEVLDRPECHPVGDGRFKALAHEAHLQGMD